MFYIKDGFPENNEIVLCTVRKIYGNTVFLTVDEYEKEGVLTISEIAPGRIRNLRDHVVENKKIVCKVLRVDLKQKRIDVSLRRVPIPVMKDKLEEIKKEEYAEKIYDDISSELKISRDDLFEKTYEPIFEEYETVFEYLYNLMLDNTKINLLTKLNDKEKEIFVEKVNLKIKPEEIVIKKKFKISSIEKNGVLLVKEAIQEALNSINYDLATVNYLGSGEYVIKIPHEDLKFADKLQHSFKSCLDKVSRERKLSFEMN